MNRVWRSSITWVSAATFLLANAPGAIALATAHAASSAQCSVPSCSLSACNHCFHTAKPKTDPSGRDHHTIGADCSDCDHLGVCASAPASTAPAGATPTSCPGCPCPGGCVFCSVAKVPCSTAITAAPAADLWLGERLSEASAILPPPFCGKLIRPPRI